MSLSFMDPQIASLCTVVTLWCVTTNGRTAVTVTSNVTMMDGEVATEAGPLLQLDLTMSLSYHRGREGGHCSCR